MQQCRIWRAKQNEKEYIKRRMKRMGRINKMNKSRDFTTLVSFAYNLLPLASRLGVGEAYSLRPCASYITPSFMR